MGLGLPASASTSTRDSPWVGLAIVGCIIGSLLL
jgi:hypothetical protein